MRGKWKETDCKLVADKIIEWGKAETILNGKWGKAKILIDAQKVLPQEKQLTENSIIAMQRNLIAKLKPYLGVNGEAHPTVEEKPLPHMPFDVDAVVQAIAGRVEGALYDMLLARLKNDLSEVMQQQVDAEVSRTVGRLLEDYFPKNNNRMERAVAERSLQKVAEEMKEGVKVRPPKVAIFGLPEHQHSTPKLNPFRKALNLNMWAGKVSDDVKAMAANADVVMVLVEHTPNSIHGLVRAGAGNRYIPVYGGTSALEAALHMLCVSKKIYVQGSTKAHEGATV